MPPKTPIRSVRNLLRPASSVASNPKFPTDAIAHTATSISRPSKTSVPDIIPDWGSKSPRAEPPLSRLPFLSVLRSLLILSISSSPKLLGPCTHILSVLANPRSAIVDVTKNPVLRWMIKYTLYKQFNGGENEHEVQRTIDSIKRLGCQGVILGYAREALVTPGDSIPQGMAAVAQEVEPWLEGTLQTVKMANEGDLVALKFTGMGTRALHLLQQRLPPSGHMDTAIRAVCDAATARGAHLIVDAEEQAVQPGIERWTLTYQRYCHVKAPHRTTMYGTYQAYLRSTPLILAKHLEISRREGYTLGVKLVRGAYLRTEPRHLIWPTKDETDQCYDRIVETLLTRQYNSTLRRGSDGGLRVPPVKVIVATHNQESVHKAHRIHRGQAARNQPQVELAFAQLQGMADEVSCELLQGGPDSDDLPTQSIKTKGQPIVYKLLVWGSIQECMGFLLRRLIENTESVGRTKQSQQAMVTELKRRIRNAFYWML